jgi:hypothetical protein
MNDYFQHLIDRSTNQTPAIRPQLPSLFESPDFHASPVIADLATEIIDHPREKTARIPVIRPGLPSLFQSPDFHASLAIADLAAETIHDSREKIEREINVPVLSEELAEKETNHLRTVGRIKQSGADIRGKETFPEKLIRGNVSANHKKDIKDTTSLPLHTQATGTFANETIINMVSRKTVLKNALHTPASPDHQPSAVADSGANQKPDTQRLTGDKAKKAARQFSQMEPAPALRTSATDSKQTHVSPAGVGKQPKIRPLIATQAGPQISSSVLPQQAPPEKTIKVTIGRIEVRAVMPQAPLFRPQTDPKETQPKISLEDYLKKQRGGSR